MLYSKSLLLICFTYWPLYLGKGNYNREVKCIVRTEELLNKPVHGLRNNLDNYKSHLLLLSGSVFSCCRVWARGRSCVRCGDLALHCLLSLPGQPLLVKAVVL